MIFINYPKILLLCTKNYYVLFVGFWCMLNICIVYSIKLYIKYNTIHVINIVT